MTLGSKIRSLRKEKRLTAEQFGKYAGVTKTAVSNWENDNRTPDTDTLIKIANFFGVTVDYLLGNAPEKQYYVDDETARQIQELINDSDEVKMLLSASRKLNSKDLDAVITIVNSMSRNKVD